MKFFRYRRPSLKTLLGITKAMFVAEQERYKQLHLKER
jgi:hypothetical protein